ncbi:MAG: hypothetical protein U5L07_07885 [Desulfobacterales bacterium]|nr:hypothetical protein [Desulfobacterales bacterium]
MNSPKNNLTERIYQAVAAAGPDGIRSRDLAWMMDMPCANHKKHLTNRLTDLMRAGRVERIARGIYRATGKKAAPNTREVMWRILRARGRADVSDLMELAGASENYAREFLQSLTRQGVTKKVRGVWYLAEDPVHLPDDTQKAARLKRIRENKKAAFAAADEAFSAIARMRMAIAEMEEE